jgi:phosphoribosylglycinamide formyltransferase-1
VQAVLDARTRHDVELVVLAGYMKTLGPRALARYRGRVLDIHPARWPRFGGLGMDGGACTQPCWRPESAKPA